MSGRHLPMYYTDNYPREGCAVQLVVDFNGRVHVSILAPTIDRNLAVIESYATHDLAGALELARKFRRMHDARWSAAIQLLAERLRAA